MTTSNLSQTGINTSRLPELQQTVLTVGADEVLVGVVGDADHILLVDLEGGQRDVRN